jgi:hypothetical protein
MTAFSRYAMRRVHRHRMGANIEQADRIVGLFSVLVILLFFVPGVIEWVVG